MNATDLKLLEESCRLLERFFEAKEFVPPWELLACIKTLRKTIDEEQRRHKLFGITA